MKIIWYITILVLLTTACDKKLHFQQSEHYLVLEEDKGKNETRGIVVGFNTDAVHSTPVANLNLFFFDEEALLYRHHYFTDMEQVAQIKHLVESGRYTIFAVFNTDADLLTHVTRSSTLPELYLSELISAINGYYANGSLYPNMVAGMGQVDVVQSIVQAIIPIDNEPAKPNVAFRLIYPTEEMPPYTKNSSLPMLRVIVEAYESGTNHCVARTIEWANSEIELSLAEGVYDIRIWSDYTLDKENDYFYHTTQTSAICISKENYIACSEYRAAYACVDRIVVSSECEQTYTMTLYRPQAQYRIIANDLDDFLDKSGNNEEFYTVSVSYGFYLPLGYNLFTGKPVNSEMGVSYTTTLQIERDESNQLLLASDYLFVNGTESFVILNIEIIDRNGRSIAGINGLKVPYKRDHLTTIIQPILTTDYKDGVKIDTNWGDDIFINLDDFFGT